MNQPDPVEPSEDEFDGRPSKTQRKKDMQALQELGAALVELGAERLRKVPMSDSLRAAVQEAQRITQHGARRRQLQYIGKLMRGEDPAPIQEALDALAGNSREEVARQHRVERLRLELLEDEGVLHKVASSWPGADLQQLRVLRRNALREREAGKPPKAFRELFKALRELDVGAAADTDD
jgi:ribosome-associated protein